MKKWMALMVAVGFILTASVPVWSDAILFPWIVKDKAISTVVSVVNTNNSAVSQLHFIYVYKPSTANNPMDVCGEYDFWVPTSPNDIVTFDAAGNFGKSSLFESGVGIAVVGGVPITLPYGNLYLNVEAPRRAYLLVSDNDNTTDGVLYGEAMVVDISIGAAWGYTAYNPRGFGNFNFEDNGADASGGLPTDQFGEVINGVGGENEMAQVVLMPANKFTTRFFVTPIGKDMLHPAWITTVFPTFDGYFIGIYDNDENPISSNKRINILCTGTFNLKDFLSEGAWNEFAAKEAQGWSYVSVRDYSLQITDPTSYKPVHQAVIGKLEYSEQRTTVGSGTITGAINNFIWLRAHSK